MSYEKRDREGGKEGKQRKMKKKKERMSSLFSNSICGYSCPWTPYPVSPKSLHYNCVLKCQQRLSFWKTKFAKIYGIVKRKYILNI